MDEVRQFLLILRVFFEQLLKIPLIVCIQYEDDRIFTIGQVKHSLRCDLNILLLIGCIVDKLHHHGGQLDHHEEQGQHHNTLPDVSAVSQLRDQPQHKWQCNADDPNQRVDAGIGGIIGPYDLRAVQHTTAIADSCPAHRAQGKYRTAAWQETR